VDTLAGLSLLACLVLLGVSLYHVVRRTGNAKRFAKYAAVAFAVFLVAAIASPSPSSEAPTAGEETAREAESSAETEGDLGEAQREETPTTASAGEEVSTEAEESSEGEEAADLEGTLAAHFLDVGQGDACLVVCPDETVLLIDAGPSSAANVVVGYLRDLDIERIDHLVFTHPHADHIGSGAAVLEAFDVSNVYMPRTGHTSQTYENLLLAIKDEGLTVTEAKAGKVLFEKQNLKAEFIGPVKAYDDLNDWSAVIALTYGDRVFVFTGDAEAAAEADMLAAQLVPDGDCLKVGHHGSSTSSTKAFLQAISPEVAVICVGADNRYGHPTAETLARLEAVGAEVYRTDQHGTVVVSTDGTSLEVETVRTPPPSGSSTSTTEETTDTTQSQTVTQPTPPTPSGEEVTVYITRTGEKYHREGCRSLSKSCIPISLSEAKARGYEPCKVCKPPR